MEECSLPKARPISCNDCPAFQRRHMSPFCAAESPNRFPWIINTTFENSVIPDGVYDPREPVWAFCRSEEHTSELQSHLNLVCRLLLEKKKRTNTKRRYA